MTANYTSACWWVKVNDKSSLNIQIEKWNRDGKESVGITITRSRREHRDARIVLDEDEYNGLIQFVNDLRSKGEL